MPLRLPPLRERSEDLPDLTRHFFKIAAQQGLPHKQMEAPALERMKKHRWPGNIRELENLVQRLAALYPQETISEHLVEVELGGEPPIAAPPIRGSSEPGGVPAANDDATLAVAVERQMAILFRDYGDQLPPPGLYHRVLREVEYPLIAAALAATRGNQIKAAELLGLNRNTLRKKVRDLDVRPMRLAR